MSVHFSSYSHSAPPTFPSQTIPYSSQSQTYSKIEKLKRAIKPFPLLFPVVNSLQENQKKKLERILPGGTYTIDIIKEIALQQFGIVIEEQSSLLPLKEETACSYSERLTQYASKFVKCFRSFQKPSKANNRLSNLNLDCFRLTIDFLTYQDVAALKNTSSSLCGRIDQLSSMSHVPTKAHQFVTRDIFFLISHAIYQKKHSFLSKISHFPVWLQKANSAGDLVTVANVLLKRKDYLSLEQLFIAIENQLRRNREIPLGDVLRTFAKHLFVPILATWIQQVEEEGKGDLLRIAIVFIHLSLAVWNQLGQERKLSIQEVMIRKQLLEWKWKMKIQQNKAKELVLEQVLEVIKQMAAAP